MTIKRQLLTPLEISNLSKDIPLWEIQNQNLITRKFHFENFIQAFAFMTKVAILAEKIDHHPNWSNIYSDVEINLKTHDLSGISNLDFELAKAIDEL